jgi:cell division protein ZapB
MIPEFNSLSEKVSRLAILTQTLRQENADLRLQMSSLKSDKEALAKRMDEAAHRIAALLEKLPEIESDAQSDGESDIESDIESEEPEFAEEKAV